MMSWLGEVYSCLTSFPYRYETNPYGGGYTPVSNLIVLKCSIFTLKFGDRLCVKAKQWYFAFISLQNRKEPGRSKTKHLIFSGLARNYLALLQNLPPSRAYKRSSSMRVFAPELQKCCPDTHVLHVTDRWISTRFAISQSSPSPTPSGGIWHWLQIHTLLAPLPAVVTVTLTEYSSWRITEEASKQRSGQKTNKTKKETLRQVAARFVKYWEGFRNGFDYLFPKVWNFGKRFVNLYWSLEQASPFVASKKVRRGRGRGWKT